MDRSISVLVCSLSSAPCRLLLVGFRSTPDIMRLLWEIRKTSGREEASNSRELVPLLTRSGGVGKPCNFNIQKELRVLQLWMP